MGVMHYELVTCVRSALRVGNYIVSKLGSLCMLEDEGWAEGRLMIVFFFSLVVCRPLDLQKVTPIK